jgi:Na+/melibiose symporter-like transporter
VCFFMGCYSYIADITSEENRSFRLSIIDALWPIGFFTGMALSSVIKTELGFTYNFALGMLCALLAMLYTIFFVKDSRKLRLKQLAKERMKKGIVQEVEVLSSPRPLPPRTSVGQKLRSLFDIRNVKKGMMATFKKREENKRTVILLIVLVFLLSMMAMMGQYAVLFLYFRRQLEWTHVEYTRYMTAAGILGVLAHLLIIPFLTSKLKWHDTTIMAVSAASVFANQFFVAFASVEWVLYVGLAVSLLGHGTSTMSRSLLSKLVGPDDVGKIFSVLGVTQALMPLVGTPFFGFLYRETVENNPAVFCFVTAGLCFVQLILILSAAYILRISGPKATRRRRAKEIEIHPVTGVTDESSKFLEKKTDK